MSLNVNSILSSIKQHKLQIFLHVNKPDILLLCETNLNNAAKVSFKNYLLISDDRLGSAGGGTAILYKNNLKVTPMKIRNIYNSDTIECTTAQLSLNYNKKIIIISLYIKPQNSNYRFANDLSLLIDKLKPLHTNTFFIIAGDFNSRHSSWDINAIN